DHAVVDASQKETRKSIARQGIGAVGGLRVRTVAVGERHAAARRGELEERESDRLIFETELHRVRSLRESNVLNEIPDVAVLDGRDISATPNSAVAPQADGEHSAIVFGLGVPVKTADP